jgi:hypothetical protein
MYFSPTARMLNAGEGYFVDFYLFFPGFAYAPADFITLGGGMSLFPGVAMDEQLLFFTPKIGIGAGKNMDFAVSSLMFFVPDFSDYDDDGDEDERVASGIFYLLGTYGNDNNSLTLGLGYGFTGDEWGDRPAVIIGGELRMSRRMSFVSENWVFPVIDEPMISYGVRFFGEKLSVDLALFNVLSDDAIFPGVPYVDFVWNF